MQPPNLIHSQRLTTSSKTWRSGTSIGFKLACGADGVDCQPGQPSLGWAQNLITLLFSFRILLLNPSTGHYAGIVISGRLFVHEDDSVAMDLFHRVTADGTAKGAFLGDPEIIADVNASVDWLGPSASPLAAASIPTCGSQVQAPSRVPNLVYLKRPGIWER